MSSTTSPTATDEISWVLTPLLELPGVLHAVIATGDGLVEGASDGLGRASAERVAAMTATLHAASRAFTTSFTDVEQPRLAQTVVESDLGFAIVVPAGENTSLAVFTTPEAQLGNVAYQMQVQVAALGRALASPARRQDATARS
ncbi:roadblock/LC7 domain-containing protein [Kitasatospora sp. A2-31]|uniref:roadblock/LC7 domain-containing protein n=1 Tax=Kitasatospora sp. A2-31 TaxID=2916414 RepID=UPI001EEBD6B1|nr:roadblock/LC7 domain-containing protein [Kitasatospora sp. A2-31]MCG6496604.1 roadblock/LC7 domain-containing protein [Kitasatospora sp. A2-31]MCG6497392.1 roadblock/LC7 domain-containing protein [Kitasatospora sp. A2-31]MCG6500150.1 roadblock/LC7 domain-containing protein [Kitasatospora sp. A2-31]